MNIFNSSSQRWFSMVKLTLITTLMKILLMKAVFAGVAITLVASSASAEALSPRRLVEVADLAGLVISPDGRKIAFRLEQASVERNTYDTTWYVQSLDGTSLARRVAEGGTPLRDDAGVPLPTAAIWAPDGRWIYYRALIDGRIAIWRAAADGSLGAPVTSDAADVREFVLSADGRTLTYSVGATREAVIAAEQAEYDRGIRVDKTTPIAQPLFRSGAVEGRLATQRHILHWYSRDPLLADVPDHWKAIDLSTGEVRDLGASYKKPAGVAEGYNWPVGVATPWKVAVEHEGRRIALLTRVGDGSGLSEKPDVQLSMLASPESNHPILCRAEQCVGKAISGIQWRPDSDEVLFTVTDPHEGLAQSIFRWNVRTGAVRRLLQTKGLVNGGRDRDSDCSASKVILVCVTADANRPPRLERIDLVTGHRRVLFDPNAALAADVAAAAPARLLRWTDAKGQTFTGQYFPAETVQFTPAPLFVTYYSCSGFLRGGIGDEWPLASLAESGIAALCINSAPYRVNPVERYDAALSAVQSVIDLLADRGEIDPARVGMGGLSFGSEVTLWTAVHSDLLAAASISSPSVEPNYRLFLSLSGRDFIDNTHRYWGLESVDETPDQWRLVSPAYQVDRIVAPILMQMPEQEYLFALGFAVPLVLRQQADLYVFPNEPHQKFQPRHKLAVYERNLDWFRFWLQGYEDPDLSKVEQYHHWREMRAAQPAKPQSH